MTPRTTTSAGRLPLEDMLTRVAQYAVQAIPGADGAGLTLIEQRRSDTIVTTADFVGEVDAVQYSLGEGPCISAARDAVTVISGSLGGDPRWPRFGGRIARLGVHSALSLPLVTPDEVVGAMNIYAHAKHAFDERAAELGELFAVPAAVAVQNARVLEETRRLAARLQNSLDQRMVSSSASPRTSSTRPSAAPAPLPPADPLTPRAHAQTVYRCTGLARR